MASTPEPQGEEFLQASENWDMERLLVDLGTAKEEVTLKKRGLSPRETTFLCLLLTQQGPEAIANKLNRKLSGVKADLSQGLYDYIERLVGQRPKNWREIIIWLEQKGYKKSLVVASEQPITPQRIDLTEAAEVTLFYGREEELSLLQRWIEEDKSRLVALLGMGGIGKTSLTFKLVQRIKIQFEYVIWRSLRNAPPLKQLLAGLIQFLSNGQKANLANNFNRPISQLVEYLREHRCLIILDNTESILQAEQVGRYRPGYEEYGELFQLLGETVHQSCLLLTSREKPREIDLLQGKTDLVRSFPVEGIEPAECQEILKTKGFSSSEYQSLKLIERYAGNPLALNLVATNIQYFWAGNISEFLSQIEQGKAEFADIRDLLEQQLSRLSSLEKELMYWLAINREPISLLELHSELVSVEAKQELPNSLLSLKRRSLIEGDTEACTQQPVVMEYMIEKLIEQIVEEIKTENISLLMSHALIKAQAKDYIRESQIRVILQPIAQRLNNPYPTPQKIEQQLRQVLAKIREEFADSPGYGAGNIINLAHQLNIDLTGYDFSQLTIWQAYLQDVSLHNVNFARSDLSKSVFAKTLGNSLTVALGQDDKLATGDEDGKITLWQISNGQELLTWEGQTSAVRSMAFNPQGTLLASGNDDQTIKIWDVNTGACLKTLAGHSDQVNCVGFSGDGQILASGSSDQTVILWQLSSGQCLQVLQGHSGEINAVTFSENSPTLASSSADQTVRLWDIDSGECLRIFPSDATKIWAVSFALQPSAHNGYEEKAIASSCDDQTIKIWDIKTSRCFQLLQGHQDLVCIAFSRDGQILASSSLDQTVKLWRISTGECLKTLEGFESPICSLAFSGDSQILACGSLERMVQLWDIRRGQRLRTLQGNTHRVWSFALSQDSQTLASGSGKKTVRLWDVATGLALRTLSGHQDWVCSLVFNPQGTILATGSHDRTIKLWQISNGECLKTLPGHQDQVQTITFSPNGAILASASDDQTVKLWDVSKGQLLHTLTGHTQSASSVVFSPNNKILASGSYDQTVRLWDVKTGDCLSTLQGHSGRLQTLAFSQDGRILASGSYDQTVKTWSVNTGECLSSRQVHCERIHAVFCCADGKLALIGSEGQTLLIWDFDNLECLKTFSGHTSQIWSVSFSLDHSTLVSGDYDQAIKLWDLTTAQCQKTLRADKPYNGMNITGVQGLGEATLTTLRALGAVEN
ncbi:MAG: NB-ARC domain-containing protein [Coleofasciculaceae cyanobacterium]